MLTVYAAPIRRYCSKYRFPPRDSALAWRDVPPQGDRGFPITFTRIEALRPVLGLSVTWTQAIAAYRAILDDGPAVTADLSKYRPRPARRPRSREAA